MEISLNPEELTSVVRGQLQHVAEEAKGAWWFPIAGSPRLVVVEDTSKHNIITWCALHILQFLFDFLSCLFPSFYKEQNTSTIRWFIKVLGEDRVMEISEKYDLHLDRKLIQGLPVSKEDVKTILAGSFCVTQDHFEQILSDILKDPERLLYMDKTQTRKVKKEFANLIRSKFSPDDLLSRFPPAKRTEKLTQREIVHPPSSHELLSRFSQAEILQAVSAHDLFTKLNTSELDFLQKILVPFDYGIAKLGDNIKAEPGYDKGFSGDGLLRLAGKMEEVVRSKVPQFASSVNFVKKVIGYFNPDNMMYRFPEGWFRLEKRFYAAGMYAVSLKSISEDLPDKVIVLPTQTLGPIPWAWEPLVEDFRQDIGSWGIKHAKKLIAHLEEKASKGEKVDVFGYSLGGTQAQRLVTLLAAKADGDESKYPVNSLMTISSPGLDWQTKELGDEYIAKFRTPIRHVRDHGDVCWTAGEGFLKSDELVIVSSHHQKKKFYSSPLDKPYSHGMDHAEALRRGMNSIYNEHANEIDTESQITVLRRDRGAEELDPSSSGLTSISYVYNPEHIDYLLDNRDNGFEEMRQNVSRLFSEHEFAHWVRSQMTTA